ncbi:hypothetical protein QTQ03_02165 [Micromonospora sp. WMMA1363]|uniref:hypothetical protein n=1 Tax=Micromonospora sp. WMMA1363 TaxID=3053985 RepID=UPI00259C6BFA|nr:hypothetical protein [Micromonospora sp. WMMA1363]MDM4718454.1 hypothetical protein [Micromonospora sp. WMMA1363]
MEFVFDPDSFDFGDMEDFEEYTGRPFDEVFRPHPVVDVDGNRVFDAKGRPEMTIRLSAKAQTCLVWLTRRKTDPGFGIEDARRTRITSLVIDSAPERDRGND